jgi:hypothetical protein
VTKFIDNNLHSNEFKKKQETEDYRIPRALLHLQSLPLYLIVAHWGMLKKKPFTPGEISMVFHLSLCRAIEIINVISAIHKNVITSQKIIIFSKNKKPKMALLISAITYSFEPSQKTENINKISRKTKTAQTEKEKLLWKWLLSRPIP